MPPQFRLHPSPPTPPPPSFSIPASLCFHLYVATEQLASSSNENNNKNSRCLPFAVSYNKRQGPITLYTYMYVIIYSTRLQPITRATIYLTITLYICICEPNIICLNSINAHFSVLCSCSDSLLSPLDPPAPESILRRSISWHEYSQLTASLVRGRRRQRQRREEETDGCGALKKLSPTRREYI